MALNFTYIKIFSVCFVISALLTWLIIKASQRLRVVSPVNEERWHKTPKPFLGGIAIFIAFAVVFIAVVEHTTMNLAIFACACVMFILGLLDDLLDLKPYIKFVYQIAIAALVAKMGVVVSFIPNPVIAMLLTVIWIVGITNAFNLLDNMDGLSGGIAVISMLSFFCIDVLRGDASLAIPALIFIGAVSGFLVFNFPPAKIFMGDSGALTIGFLLGVYSIQGTWHQASNLFLLLVTPLLLVGVPIFDTAIVSIQRILHKRPVYVGGKDHTSHRLVALGWSETQAVLALYSIALLLGAVAVFGFAINKFLAIQIALLLLVGMIVLGLFLSEAKIYTDQDAVGRRPSQFAAFFPFIPHKRRIVEICIDTILIVVAYVSAHLLRYDLRIDAYNWGLIQQALPIVVAIKLIAMLFGGMYSGFWKYLDFDSAKRIVLSVSMASFGSITVLVGVYRFAGYSRSVFIIDFLLLLVLVVGFRVMLRSLRESFYGYKKEGRRVLIVGAGEASQNFLDDVRRDVHSDLNPIGIVDDDPWKKGRKLFGVTVVGDRRTIQEFVELNSVEEIVLAMPSANPKQMEAILEICEKTGLPLRQL